MGIKALWSAGKCLDMLLITYIVLFSLRLFLWEMIKIAQNGLALLNRTYVPLASEYMHYCVIEGLYDGVNVF